MLLMPINSLFAQNIEQIYTRNGSIIEGYISEQVPGKHITIQSVKATIIANSDSLLMKITQRIPLDSLSNEWRIWAEQNNKLIDNSGEKQLELYTLKFNNNSYNDVFLLEKGSTIKFLDLTPNRYVLCWKDMYRIVKNKRPDNLFSGLKEIVILKDGSKVEGQIIEQISGISLNLLTDKGEILSYKNNQIEQISTTRLNDKYDLWIQIQLLDRIKIKGERSYVEGFISSRVLGKELVIEFEDGSKRTVALNKIASYAKVPNPEYVAMYDTKLQKGEILLNGESAYFDVLKPQGQFLLLSEMVSAQMSIGDIVCVEANLANPDVTISLAKAHYENIGTEKKPNYWPVITYQDLVQSHVAIDKEITPLGNTKISFVLNEIGDYVLYIQGKEGYIVINVIE